MGVGCVAIPLLVALIVVAAFFYVRINASTRLTVPDHASRVALVRTLPDDAAPLLARFGAGRNLTLTGRSEDWRWLEVELWDGQRGWMRRPLDILVWQLEAAPTTPQAPAKGPPPLKPVAEEMVTLPATTFTMGSPTGIGEADEQPPHPVALSAFALDKTEVTVGHYWECVIAEACAPPTADASQTQPHYLNDPAFDNHPVINVPWGEANNYCLWWGKRLPTEAEWELAASWNLEQGAKLLWVWGNDPEQEQGNLGRHSLGDTAPVGSFPADHSASGVLDLSGNVSEWVFDWYKVDYYSVADDTDPLGPTNRRGEGTGRVVRGGSFAGDIAAARTTNRQHQAAEYGYPTVGFRCVQDVE
jgi:formylglycine-generating enzyme required for sulfatase activity